MGLRARLGIVGNLVIGGCDRVVSIHLSVSYFYGLLLFQLGYSRLYDTSEWIYMMYDMDYSDHQTQD